MQVWKSHCLLSQTKTLMQIWENSSGARFLKKVSLFLVELQYMYMQNDYILCSSYPKRHSLYFFSHFLCRTSNSKIDKILKELDEEVLIIKSIIKKHTLLTECYILVIKKIRDYFFGYILTAVLCHRQTWERVRRPACLCWRRTRSCSSTDPLNTKENLSRKQRSDAIWKMRVRDDEMLLIYKS